MSALKHQTSQDQPSLCFRWVITDLEVHEKVVPWALLDYDISADTISARLPHSNENLQCNRCSGQCYDGATVVICLDTRIVLPHRSSLERPEHCLHTAMDILLIWERVIL